MNYLEVTVRTAEEASESVANLFWEANAGGVVIEDPSVIRRHIEDDGWDAWEIPEEILRQEDVVIKGYFPVDAGLLNTMSEFKLQLEAVAQQYPDGRISITETEVAAEDWATTWKAFFKTEKIGTRLVIKPSWEKYTANAGEVVVELDPGMAFGTGSHATTAMCIRALEKTVFPGCRVLDVGTGSGVLAVSAAKLGAAQVLALDLDPVSIDAAKENVTVNGVEDQVTVRQGDLLSGVSGEFDGIVANIIADVIIRLAPQAAGILQAGGFLIASGIIRERLADVVQALPLHGFKVEEITEEGEWAALIARRE